MIPLKEIKTDCYKGTRILLGNNKRTLINKMIGILVNEYQFQEISIPVIQLRETFKNKVGIENTSMMFSVKDNNPDRDLVLAPEYTAVVQKLANTQFKYQKDVKLFYVQECFRGEKPQDGRYRQFTQLGVEILNPTKDYFSSSISLDVVARQLCMCNPNFKLEKSTLNKNVVRGLDYYKEGRGFEVQYEELGSSKQICGGGEYQGGVGFAIGIDRLLNIQ